MPTVALLPEATRGPGIGYFGPITSTVTGTITFIVTVTPQTTSGTASVVLMRGGRLLLIHTGEVGNVVVPGGATIPSGFVSSVTVEIQVAQEFEAVLASTVAVTCKIEASR